MNNLTGIYIIFNTITEKFYIGSAVNYRTRFNEHKRKLRKNIHVNKKLQNAWNKYGEINFQFYLAEPVKNRENLLEREQWWLDLYKPKYNIALSATAPMLGKKHTKKSIRKIKEYLKTAPKGKDHPNYGKTWSNKRKKEFSKKKKSMCLKHSEKTKKRMSNTNKKLKRYKDLIPAIEKFKKQIIDSNGKLFKSLTETAKHHKISIQTVCDILKGRHSKTRKKVSFKYV